MAIQIIPHALERMEERKANKEEVEETVLKGEQFPVKFGRLGFRKNFQFNAVWNGNLYATKQLEVIAVKENKDWIVITIVTKFF
jgi:hypothetical protein